MPDLMSKVEATAIDGTEYMLGVQGGKTKRFKAALLKGQKGEPGKTPVKGIDYFDGIDGKDGLDGTNGIDGKTPEKGKDYVDGAPGLSAYQIAVNNGYKGTEQQWLRMLQQNQLALPRPKSASANLYLHKNYGGY